MARHPSFKPNAVEIPDLYTLSLECLAAHPENIRCLHGVPEEVAISLFDVRSCQILALNNLCRINRFILQLSNYFKLTLLLFFFYMSCSGLSARGN